MRLVLELHWRRPRRQQVFGFIQRSRRHERWFKGLILVATCLAIALLGALPRGRYLSSALAARARGAGRYAIGLPTPREEIDDSWRRYRTQGIADAREKLDDIFAEASPEIQRLMCYAGLDPEGGLLRWGNYNRTLLLPSKVIEADDTGRSYRLRASLHSIWLRNVSPRSSIPMFFLVPDGPSLAEAIHGTPAIPVEASRQSTNSWGLRGPEPDPQAPLRVIVLGDSFMQGLFIGDDETPPECLRRYLEEHLKTRVSVLNTGVLGHSPEQYYYSLRAFVDRFRPHAVVVSTFTNDFGGDSEVPTQGEGDWDEGKYWLDRITQFCRSRQWSHLIVPVPYVPNLFGRRKAGYYPGILTNILEVSSLMFVDPAEDFINAHLELTVEQDREGQASGESSLFNTQIGDGHFSALGSEVWANAVGHRLVLLLKRDQVWYRKPRTSPRVLKSSSSEDLGSRCRTSGPASPHEELKDLMTQ
jgi:lysophospholipase L1-like esterase